MPPRGEYQRTFSERHCQRLLPPTLKDSILVNTLISAPLIGKRGLKLWFRFAGEWGWPQFHVLTSHLYFFFWELSPFFLKPSIPFFPFIDVWKHFDIMGKLILYFTFLLFSPPNCHYSFFCLSRRELIFLNVIKLFILFFYSVAPGCCV